MGDVVNLPVITRLDIEPADVLRGAVDAGLEEVIVIGRRGEEDHFAASTGDVERLLWRVEKFKHWLMERY